MIERTRSPTRVESPPTREPAKEKPRPGSGRGFLTSAVPFPDRVRRLSLLRQRSGGRGGSRTVRLDDEGHAAVRLGARVILLRLRVDQTGLPVADRADV